MSDHRSVLERASASAPSPNLPLERVLHRRDRVQRNRRIRAGMLGIGVAIAVGWLGINVIRSSSPVPADDRSEELGIFAPVAGRIVYGNRGGIWGVDPTAPAQQGARVQLTSDRATPLGWSADGTELLIMRTIRREREGAMPAPGLSILHADGSETPLTTDPMTISGATIAPDGSRVVFAGATATADGDSAMYAVDADGSPVEVLLESRDGMVSDPIFSPDGTQIAYVEGSGDHSHHVWVMNADGSGAREIVFNATTAQAGHVNGLAWSPTGDRIALGLDTAGIYTFATDGSGFTEVTRSGDYPNWSPDGSRIAYSLRWPFNDSGRDPGPLAIVDADGSNVREFGFAASGPWHPGTSVEDAPPPEIPTPTPDAANGAAPDPSALAYGVDGDVFLADADGSNAVKIADGAPVDGADDCAPGEERAEYAVFGTAWSPDGRYLAYWDWGCPVPEGAWGTVRITDAAGNLVASFAGQGWQISWSPDSTRVAVMDVWAPADQADATIGVYGLDGTRQATLAVPSELTPSGDYSPVWSRDGSSILLPSVQVPLDGEAPTPLPGDLRRTGSSVYSPDGSRFAYVDRGSLVVEDADQPEAQKVSGAWEFWDVAWSPNGELVAYGDGRELLVRDVAIGADTSLVNVPRPEYLNVLEFSPDGERILFTRSDVDGGRTSLWSIGVDGSDLRRLADGVDWADLRPQGRTEEA